MLANDYATSDPLYDGGRTKIAVGPTVTWLPHEASAAERKAFDEGRASRRQGWGGTLDQLVGPLRG